MYFSTKVMQHKDMYMYMHQKYTKLMSPARYNQYSCIDTITVSSYYNPALNVT